MIKATMPAYSILKAKLFLVRSQLTFGEQLPLLLIITHNCVLLIIFNGSTSFFSAEHAFHKLQIFLLIAAPNAARRS